MTAPTGTAIPIHRLDGPEVIARFRSNAAPTFWNVRFLKAGAPSLVAQGSILVVIYFLVSADQRQPEQENRDRNTLR